MKGLQVANLSVRNAQTDELLLRDISLSVGPGEVVGLVGESGSGKSMTALALMGLLPQSMVPAAGTASVAAHQYLSGGRVSQRAEIAMIFQNPRAALNPTMRIGRQLERICRLRDADSAREARARSLDLLSKVGIPGAATVARAYPHQLSGGMCQRVMIAMALASRPSVLIADEPTTGLDVTVQAQILALLIETAKAASSGVLLITHDLAVVGQLCDRVAVLYGGQVMEYGSTEEIFSDPRSPYSVDLIASSTAEVDPDREDPGVDFSVTGCRLIKRCPLAGEVCAQIPPAVQIGNRIVNCHRVESAE